MECLVSRAMGTIVLVLYRIVAVLIPLQHFPWFQIEHDSPLRRPLAAVVRKDGRSRPQVSNGFDVFHVAARDRFEAYRRSDESH